MGTGKINTARESYRDPKQLISSNMRFAREIRIQEHEATDANRQKYKFSGSEKSKSFYFLDFDKRKLQVVAVVVCALFLLTMNYYGAFSFDIDRRSPDPEPKAVPEPEPKPQPEPELGRNNTNSSLIGGSIVLICIGFYILISHSPEARAHGKRSVSTAKKGFKKAYNKNKWW